MSGEHLLTIPCTVVDRVPQLDDAKELIRDDYGVVQTVAARPRATRCWHEQTGSDEAHPIGEEIREAWFLPADPISATSKVTIGSLDFEVVGPPSRPVNPRTRQPGLVKATLKRTTG